MWQSFLGNDCGTDDKAEDNQIGTSWKQKLFFCIQKTLSTEYQAEWEKILANHTSDKGLISRKYRELKTQQNNNNTLIQKRTEIWHFSEEDTKWQISTWGRGCSTSLIMRECKSKLQWDTTSHSSKNPRKQALGSSFEPPQFNGWFTLFMQQKTTLTL